MAISIDRLFEDCHRRAGIQESREGAVNLDTLWAALCYPSDMDSAARVYFTPVFSDAMPRVLHWYKLTEAGKREYMCRYVD